VRDVIIVGAGTAGIAASKVLNEKKISHIILESRDRIGGRIVDGEIDGMRVDLGASFVHNPGPDNPLHLLITSMNWSTVPGQAKKTQEFSLNKYSLNDQESAQYSSAVTEMQTFIGQFAKD
jgi:monoamine oxidase